MKWRVVYCNVVRRKKAQAREKVGKTTIYCVFSNALQLRTVAGPSCQMRDEKLHAGAREAHLEVKKRKEHHSRTTVGI